MGRLAVSGLLVCAACASPDLPLVDDGTWVGTITTEGNVTTVVNESGSVWGGPARLAEELSIGVESGEPEYMLGPARGLWDSGDRIVYADLSVPAVRVYDREGAYLGDVGREGQGPGEYQYPFSVAVLSGGRIVVTNAESGWVDLYDSDLRYLERWGPYPDDLTAPGARLNHALVVGTDGTLYLDYWEWPDGSDLRRGWRSIGPEGLGPVVWNPEFGFQDLRNCYRSDCSLYGSVQYSPSVHRTVLPNGNMVAGVSDEYSFEIRRGDGSVTAVRRYWDPVVLSDEEWEYWRQRERAEGVARSPDWQPSWSAAVPRHKPAFRRFYATREGRIVVMREGPSRRVDSCTEDPLGGDASSFVSCWESTQVLDFFDAEGRYLGEVEAPAERLLSVPFIVDERLTAAIMDEAGTIMVKRYRLVLLGEE